VAADGAVAQDADRLGVESIWLFDHFHTIPAPTDEITFESFTTLTALAALTSGSASATSSSAPGSGTRRSRPR
jgi:alkanesulfonate monooxygenase SsuD/methylene tetrahydromethanopterin reductase-like flavin-dependent oxidoreductase (luciferase family)